jgi:hypothetical protein
MLRWAWVRTIDAQRVSGALPLLIVSLGELHQFLEACW